MRKVVEQTCNVIIHYIYIYIYILFLAYYMYKYASREGSEETVSQTRLGIRCSQIRFVPKPCVLVKCTSRIQNVGYDYSCTFI